MKRILLSAFLILLLLSGCRKAATKVEIVATTAPVYEFTATICAGTDIQVAQLITEDVSCLHDYTLQASQMYLLEQADHVIISGFGLEDTMEDALKFSRHIIDSSAGIAPLCVEGADDHGHEHNHEQDPHIWLSPANAAIMAENIYKALIQAYPEHSDRLLENYEKLAQNFAELSNYADDSLSKLSSRELITFHDGFAYMANAFNLHILHSIEEESGSEASAEELISICKLVEDNQLPAIFTETNGSNSAAKVIANETGVKVYKLDTAMSGDGYFEAMYRNINTLKEALQ